MKIRGECLQCGRFHVHEFNPLVGYGSAVSDWYVKHAGHQGVRICWPGRSRKRRLTDRLDTVGRLLHNADLKIAYGTEVAVSITIHGMAASATLVAGAEGDAIDNTSNKYLDYLLGGKITTGTSPTAGTIEIWGMGQINDSPIYPDQIDGANSAETMTSRDILLGAGKLCAVLTTDSNSNRTYWFGPSSVASLFGGSVPPRWTPFVTQATVAALNNTSSNQELNIQPVYATAA